MSASTTYSTSSVDHAVSDNGDHMMDEQITKHPNKLTTDQLLEIISEQIEKLITQTDNDMELKDQNEFHSAQQPSISIFDYLQRILKFTQCSEVCFLLALIYIDRIQQRKREFILNGFTVHRYLLVAIVVSMKFYEDKYYQNEYYAQVGGIPKDQFNTLEAEFLYMCDFELHVQPDLYNQYYNTLCEKKQNYKQITELPIEILNDPTTITDYYHVNSITTQFSNIFNNYNYHHHLEENYKKNYLQEVLSE